MLLHLLTFALALCVACANDSAEPDNCALCATQMLSSVGSEFNAGSLKTHIGRYCRQTASPRVCTQHLDFSMHTCCVYDLLKEHPRELQDEIASELVERKSVVKACKQIGCLGAQMCPDLSLTPKFEAFLNKAAIHDTTGVSEFLQLSQKLRRHLKKSLVARSAHSSTTAQTTGHLVKTWLKVSVGGCGGDYTDETGKTWTQQEIAQANRGMDSQIGR